jgi:hypothetical protein
MSRFLQGTDPFIPLIPTERGAPSNYQVTDEPLAFPSLDAPSLKANARDRGDLSQTFLYFRDCLLKDFQIADFGSKGTKSLIVKALALAIAAFASPDKKNRSLTPVESTRLIETFLGIAAATLAGAAAEKGDLASLERLSRSLDFLPQTPENLISLAYLLATSLSSLDSDRKGSLAGALLSRLMALPLQPETRRFKIKGILATMFLSRDDPSLKRALELKKELEDLGESLGQSPEIFSARLRAIGILISLCQAHGRQDLAKDLLEEALAISHEFMDPEALAEALAVSLSGPIDQNQAIPAIRAYEVLVDLPSSKNIDRHKAKAALALLSQATILDRTELAVRVFLSLNKLNGSGAFNSQLKHKITNVGANFLTRLADSGRDKELKRCLWAVKSYQRKYDRLSPAKANLAISIDLAKVHLEAAEASQGLAAKTDSEGRAQNIPDIDSPDLDSRDLDNPDLDSPNLDSQGLNNQEFDIMEEKANLRLACIENFAKRGNLARAKYAYKAFSSLDPVSPPVVLAKAKALGVLASLAWSLKDPELFYGYRDEMAELALMANFDWPLSRVDRKRLTSLKNDLDLLALLYSVASGPSDKAYDAAKSFLRPASMAARPKESVRAALAISAYEKESHLAESPASRQLAARFSQKKAFLGRLVPPLDFNGEREDLKDDFMGDRLGERKDDREGDCPGDERLNSLIVSASSLKGLTDENLYRCALAEIQLLNLKRLLAKGRYPQASPLLASLEERQSSEDLTRILAEGLFAAVEATAKEGLFFAKFKLSRPARTGRDGAKGQAGKGAAGKGFSVKGAAGKDAGEKNERKLQKSEFRESLERSNDNGSAESDSSSRKAGKNDLKPLDFNAELWLEKLLALPDLVPVALLKRQAVRVMVEALSRAGYFSEAQKTLRLIPRPLPADGYAATKVYLNGAFALIEDLSIAEPALALRLARETLDPDTAESGQDKVVLGGREPNRSFLAGYAERYYLRELAGLYRAAQIGLPSNDGLWLRSYLLGFADPLAKSYLKKALDLEGH